VVVVSQVVTAGALFTEPSALDLVTGSWPQHMARHASATRGVRIRNMPAPRKFSLTSLPEDQSRFNSKVQPDSIRRERQVTDLTPVAALAKKKP
jgi:hypothetical protein